MTVDQIVRSVINLPRDFHMRADASPYSLLRESGYFTIHGQITEAMIRRALSGQPQLVEEWLEFSESKRASSGWYLVREGSMSYQVGHTPVVVPEHEPVSYSDGIVACAAFVKREIEDMRRL